MATMPKHDERAILQHLSHDPQLAPLIGDHVFEVVTPTDDIYLVLLKSIMEQQVSLKAAATIWGRFLHLFDQEPTPEKVLRTPDEVIQKCGTSFIKVGYLKNIARFALEDDLRAAYLKGLSDDAAITHLCKIKGVGKWTAEMILMFALNRPDVFPIDDLVVRNSMIKLYNVSSTKRQLKVDLENIAMRWRPYRSYACYALWHHWEG